MTKNLGKNNQSLCKYSSRNIEIKALVDSTCTIIPKNLSNAVVVNNKDSYGRKPSGLQGLKTFSNDIIKTVGVIYNIVKSNDWLAEDSKVTVEEVCRRPTIGRDLFPYLGLSSNELKQIMKVNQNQFPIKQKLALVFPALTSCNGKSLNYTVQTIFHKNFAPDYQIRRGIPINLQPLVNAELQKIIEKNTS